MSRVKSLLIALAIGVVALFTASGLEYLTAAHAARVSATGQR